MRTEYLIMAGLSLLLLCQCQYFRKSSEDNTFVEEVHGPQVFRSKPIQDSLNMFMEAADSCDVINIWIEKEERDTVIYFIASPTVYPKTEWNWKIFRPVGAMEAEGKVIALAYINIDSTDMIVDEHLYMWDVYERNSYNPYSSDRRMKPDQFFLPSQRVYKVHNGSILELLSVHKSRNFEP